MKGNQFGIISKTAYGTRDGSFTPKHEGLAVSKLSITLNKNSLFGGSLGGSVS